jgi:hypothetical protein
MCAAPGGAAGAGTVAGPGQVASYAWVMRGSVTVHMAASPDRVWDLVSDITDQGSHRIRRPLPVGPTPELPVADTQPAAQCRPQTRTRRQIRMFARSVPVHKHTACRLGNRHSRIAQRALDNRAPTRRSVRLASFGLWPGPARRAKHSALERGQGLARTSVSVSCGQAAFASRGFGGHLDRRVPPALPDLAVESTFPGRLASYGHDGPCIPGWHGAAARSLSSCGAGGCR